MEVCDELSRRYPTWAAGLVIYGDATGRNRSTVSTKTNYDIIMERLAKIGPLDLKVRSSNPSVSMRLNAVNLLCQNAEQRCRLYLKKTDPARECLTRPLVHSLQRTVKKSGTDDLEKKPGETITHHGDALGYWLAYEFPAQRPHIPVGMARSRYLN
jgi:hypothetical protein